MSMPASFEKWVAMEGDSPTIVVEPCYIPHTAVADLMHYHPGFDNSEVHAFRHVADKDPATEEWYIHADSLSYNWQSKMAAVMLELRFKVVGAGSNEMLLDDQIGLKQTPLMHGWKVMRWVVVQTVDRTNSKIHQDLITWEKDVSRVETVFSWKPYRQQALAAMRTRASLNGRSFTILVQ